MGRADAAKGEGVGGKEVTRENNFVFRLGRPHVSRMPSSTCAWTFRRLFDGASALQPKGWLLSRRRRYWRCPAKWLWADGTKLAGPGQGRRGNRPEGRRNIPGAESVRDAQARARYHQAVQTEKVVEGATQSSNVVPQFGMVALRKRATPRWSRRHGVAQAFCSCLEHTVIRRHGRSGRN